jgi:Xaa-Pro aminopeptidase
MARRSLTRPRAPLFPDHPQEEHDLRVSRTRQLMQEAGLDAVVFSRNVNAFYMTGSRFVFVGRDAPSAGVPQTMAIVTADADIYCQRFGPFDSDDVPIDTTLSASFELLDSERELPNILSDYGIAKGAKVGIEWGPDAWTGISPLLFGELQGLLEDKMGIELVDSGTLVRSLTAIKSPFEIQRMSAAVEATSRAMNRLYDEITLGMLATDVSRLVSRLMLEEGGETVHHSQVMIESGGSQLRSCNAVQRPLEPGYVHLDLGCEIGRYGADIHRGLFLGRQPTSEETAVYTVRKGVNDLLETLIRPGVSIDSVVQSAADYVEENDMQMSRRGGEPVTGHSIGMENYIGPNLVTKSAQPALVGKEEGEDLLFQEGMMFTLECTVSLKDKSWPIFNIEDDVVVTETGVRNMSVDVTRDLIIRA